jgi:hypothetical protein
MSAIRYDVSQSQYKYPYGSGSGSGSGSSGYHESSHGKEDECCPLVVDLICLAILLAALVGATVLLGRVIQIEIMMGRRKRRFVDAIVSPPWLISGEESIYNDEMDLITLIVCKPDHHCRYSVSPNLHKKISFSSHDL